MTVPRGKAARQHRIVSILENHSVTNQVDLVAMLADAGLDVSQTTVSRDLDELGAIKVRVPGGHTAYAVPESPAERPAPDDYLRRVLGEWVVEIERSSDLVVVRTPPGSAHVVGSALDRSGLDDVLGTVAGDDTMLVVAAEGRGAAVAAILAEYAELPSA